MWGKMNKIIDLHMHSTASDGTDTPKELVHIAKKAGLSAMALTDHDTLAGLEEAEKTAREERIEFVPGCEISTASEYGSQHILGLWVPKANPYLKDFLLKARERRKNRNLQMFKNLEKVGIAFQPEELAALDMTSLGRPHIAALLVAKGIVPDYKTAFNEYIGKGCPAYVPKASPEASEAIKILAECGATVVWAHPLLYPLAQEQLETLIQRYAKAGLTAIEVWHSAHTPEQTRLLTSLAKKYNLNESGGSDYHGRAKPDIKPATGRANLHLSYEILEKLKASRVARGLPC